MVARLVTTLVYIGNNNTPQRHDAAAARNVIINPTHERI